VQRVPYERALVGIGLFTSTITSAPTSRPKQRHRHGIDSRRGREGRSIRSAGAAVHYWPGGDRQVQIKATVVSDVVAPTFRFMTVDWDGKIRMGLLVAVRDGAVAPMRDRFGRRVCERHRRRPARNSYSIEWIDESESLSRGPRSRTCSAIARNWRKTRPSQDGCEQQHDDGSRQCLDRKLIRRRSVSSGSWTG